MDKNFFATADKRVCPKCGSDCLKYQMRSAGIKSNSKYYHRVKTAGIASNLILNKAFCIIFFYYAYFPFIWHICYLHQNVSKTTKNIFYWRWNSCGIRNNTFINLCACWGNCLILALQPPTEHLQFTKVKSFLFESLLIPLYE